MSTAFKNIMKPMKIVLYDNSSTSNVDIGIA